MSFSDLVTILRPQDGLTIREIDSNTIEVFSSDKSIVVSVNEDKSSAWIISEEWLSRPEIIASKIVNKLGCSKRIHARKCEVRRLEKPVLDDFLSKNHINGSAGSKYKFGLYFNDELVAAVSFSTPRNFQDKRSAELVRYCVKCFYSIPGGLDKLLKHYIKTYPCDDIFTYVDLGWSNGQGFRNIGFKEEGTKEVKGREVLKLRKIIDRNSSHPHT